MKCLYFEDKLKLMRYVAAEDGEGGNISSFSNRKFLRLYYYFLSGIISSYIIIDRVVDS